MTEIKNSKQYNLEDRTYLFARKIRDFVRIAPKNLANIEYIKQLIRSSSSVGANYIEANEALSRKDFELRIKICRKEAKESIYWLKLIETEESLQTEQNNLINECTELMKIFGSIITKCRK